MAKTKTEEKTPAAPEIPRGGANVTNLPVDKISIKKGFNPRKDLGDLTELRHSMKSAGILQPIVVCPTKPGASTYYVIAGHRRFTVWSDIGKPNIPVLIRDVDINSDEAFALAVSENSEDARSELSPVEQADAFKRLLDSNDGSEMAVAKLVGYSTTHVKRTLKLLSVPDSVRQRVRAGEISKRAAIAVADIDDAKIRARVVKDIGKDTTEADIRKMVTEAKRDAKVAAKDDEDTVKPETEAPETPKSLHNTPIGNRAGDKAVNRGNREVRAMIEEQARHAMGAFVNKNKAGWNTHGGALAALLWFVGRLETIPADINADEAFQEAFNDIAERLGIMPKDEEQVAEGT